MFIDFTFLFLYNSCMMNKKVKLFFKLLFISSPIIIIPSAMISCSNLNGIYSDNAIKKLKYKVSEFNNMLNGSIRDPNTNEVIYVDDYYLKHFNKSLLVDTLYIFAWYQFHFFMDIYSNGLTEADLLLFEYDFKNVNVSKVSNNGYAYSFTFDMKIGLYLPDGHGNRQSRYYKITWKNKNPAFLSASGSTSSNNYDLESDVETHVFRDKNFKEEVEIEDFDIKPELAFIQPSISIWVNYLNYQLKL